jgi:hypothetical protein
MQDACLQGRCAPSTRRMVLTKFHSALAMVGISVVSGICRGRGSSSWRNETQFVRDRMIGSRTTLVKSAFALTNDAGFSPAKQSASRRALCSEVQWDPTYWRLATGDRTPLAPCQSLASGPSALSPAAVLRQDVGSAFQRSGRQPRPGVGRNGNIMLTCTIRYGIIRSRSIRFRANDRGRRNCPWT